MRSETDLGLAGGATAPTIDGMTPTSLVEPATPRDAADLLADAAARGLAVAPVGGGTALGLGNPPARLDLALSTARLGGVLDYEPTDLVLSVGAGARLGDVQAVLAEHGQELPIDPPGGDEATIGGLVATALAGPRRLSAGTLRDLLIGIAVAHPSGTVTKAGGMVVKNVTGFDLPRLYHGSLGTLGVVVSANFKVLPSARAEATVVAGAPAAELAVAAASRLRASRVEPAALEVAWRDGAWSTAVRLVGREATVRTLAEETRLLLGGDGLTLSDDASDAWWRRYVEAQAPTMAADEAVVRLTVRPRATADLIRDLVAVAAEREVDASYLGASLGLGAVVARLRIGDDEAGDRFRALRERLLAIADHVVVLAVPPVWKRGLDVWGRPPEALEVMRALKEQFDPKRVLNPGRFAGRI
jgi:glycolate oxidase FAD binding subunit